MFVVVPKVYCECYQLHTATVFHLSFGWTNSWVLICDSVLREWYVLVFETVVIAVPHIGKWELVT